LLVLFFDCRLEGHISEAISQSNHSPWRTNSILSCRRKKNKLPAQADHVYLEPKCGIL
jgi:hypothetical protein